MAKLDRLKGSWGGGGGGGDGKREGKRSRARELRNGERRSAREEHVGANVKERERCAEVQTQVEAGGRKGAWGWEWEKKRRKRGRKRSRKRRLGDWGEWAPARCMLIGEQVLGLGAGGWLLEPQKQTVSSTHTHTHTHTPNTQLDIGCTHTHIYPRIHMNYLRAKQWLGKKVRVGVMQTHRQLHIHPYTYINKRARMLTHTHTHTWKYTSVCMHTNIEKHTQNIHTHLGLSIFLLSLLFSVYVVCTHTQTHTNTHTNERVHMRWDKRAQGHAKFHWLIRN